MSKRKKSRKRLSPAKIDCARAELLAADAPPAKRRFFFDLFFQALRKLRRVAEHYEKRERSK